MLNFKSLKDNGIVMSYTTMVQMFKGMMKDRDTMTVKEWMSRYSGYLMDVATSIMKTNGIDFDEKETMKFASVIAHSVYTKEYDKMVDDDIKMSDMEDFIKASEGKHIAKS
jgi:hypothetical protein